jgi:hypothetical protein
MFSPPAARRALLQMGPDCKMAKAAAAAAGSERAARFELPREASKASAPTAAPLRLCALSLALVLSA